MKSTSIFFLQSVILLFGIAVFAFLIRVPLTEGRSVNLDLFHIYADPFILYGYVCSVPFFVALFRVFKILGYIRHSKLFTLDTVGVLKSLKYCAILLSIFAFAAGIVIKLFHVKDDITFFFVLILNAI